MESNTQDVVKKMRALIVEDAEDDAVLLVDYLRSRGMDIDWLRVETEQELNQALKKTWDIVFSDYTMPGFSGAHALNILRKHDLDLPFIFVSGTLGEEAVVEAMKAGAQDYVMKGNFTRLLTAIDRVLLDANLRRERRKSEQARTWLVEILEATPDLVAIIGVDGYLRYLNASGRSLLGVKMNDNIETRKIDEFLNQPMVQKMHAEIIPKVHREGVWRGEAAINKQGNGDIPVSQVMIAHYDSDNRIEYISMIACDISERKRFELELQHRATHDGLTELPNRFFLLDRFKTALENSKRHNRHIAVLFLDMDNFKRVNDALGHAVGDALLQQVAKRLRACLRPSDTVARHGGDEFTVLLEDLNSSESAVAVLRKLRSAFEAPFILGEHSVYVTFSTGIAVFPDDGTVVEDLLRHADIAMYQAKSLGTSQYRFYAPEMNARGHEFLTLEADLRKAIAENEFQLYYQPQMDIRSGQVVAYESLIRWQHPTRGLIMPGDFVPLLERSGLIVPVGEWVLRKACHQHRVLREAGFPDYRISINVSALQFSGDDLLDTIERALREEQMPPHMMELEITENIVMADPIKAAEILEALNTIGVRTAIDDFGTGYSSLASLKRFPLTVLKIDQSFISDLTTNASDAAIVEASILLAKKLDLELVAEGVETRQQLDFLRDCDCDLVQGYYLSPPMTSSRMLDLLRLGHTQIGAGR